jgi:hypothetical protein
VPVPVAEAKPVPAGRKMNAFGGDAPACQKNYYFRCPPPPRPSA